MKWRLCVSGGPNSQATVALSMCWLGSIGQMMIMVYVHLHVWAYDVVGG